MAGQVAALGVQLGSNKNKFWLDDIMHIAIVTYPPMYFVAIQTYPDTRRNFLPQFQAPPRIYLAAVKKKKKHKKNRGFLHSCEIKSGCGLGMRLPWLYEVICLQMSINPHL